jgi:hypothetical protein
MVEIKKQGIERYLAPIRAYEDAQDIYPHVLNIPVVRFKDGKEI